ncbi:SGNH/GDSL hydrolase family protein [Prauserella flavalba]|uniref:GDSL family lipase n=1 Tax=Prauserella flavalba TaxID=1477506 RepID=A0A318LDS5_9PSEU|nr:SGNH/GDSL hydrolase family protein [Prauserella flavalba]PXY20034.1 GDSL family lipase [Prauserella flavalba]
MSLSEHSDPHCLTDEVLFPLLSGAPWRRFAVLGDSVAEGVGDLLDGYPPVPWADRVAAALRAHNPVLEYLNLGKRGLFAEEVSRFQLSPALAFEPDLAVVACGGNDMLRRSYDPGAVEVVLAGIVRALREAGSEVVTVGLFDITRSPVLAPEVSGGLETRLHDLSGRTRAIAEREGAWHADLTSHPASSEASIYSVDGIHVNGRGHAIAATETIRLLAAHLQ